MMKTFENVTISFSAGAFSNPLTFDLNGVAHGLIRAAGR